MFATGPSKMFALGALVRVGFALGSPVGTMLGLNDGETEGRKLGILVGIAVMG